VEAKRGMGYVRGMVGSELKQVEGIAILADPLGTPHRRKGGTHAAALMLDKKRCKSGSSCSNFQIELYFYFFKFLIGFRFPTLRVTSTSTNQSTPHHAPLKSSPDPASVSGVTVWRWGLRPGAY
jgi:hypothetical protein